MNFELLTLGTNAAMPGRGQITSAQLLIANDQFYLLDCGEGTQIKLEKYRIKRNKIQAIFISHLHGDHIFGLPGLITSFGHFHRKEKLLIFGPQGLKYFVDCILQTTQAFLGYEIIIQEIKTDCFNKIFSNKNIEVSAFPLKHRLPTLGYLFTEKPKNLNIIPSIIEKYALTFIQIRSIKSGNNLILPDGRTIENRHLVHQASPLRKYAWCTDTAYDETIVPYIRDVDLLYHETTYLDDMQAEAAERMHSTISDATRIATLAGAKKLLTGHYSSRYENPEVFEKEGKKHFENTYISREGEKIKI